METNFPLDIVFDSINVNAFDSQSGIFIGENTQSTWTTHSKTNSGFGTVEGMYNIVKYPVSIVYDPDFIDNPSYSSG